MSELFMARPKGDGYMKTKTKPCLEQLEDRVVPAAASIFGPNAAVSYHGGQLLTHPQVTNVYIPGAPNMDAFTNVLVGPYGNALASVYGVGSGTFVQSINSSHSPTISDGGIQNLLRQDFKTGGVAAACTKLVAVYGLSAAHPRPSWRLP